LIARLHIRYQDGSTAEVISDESWKAAASPITFSSIYGGEDYNANLEQPGWDQPAFDDTPWQNAVITDGPPVLKANRPSP
jgi:Alpha-L-rhamnosidase N-terminal domain.